MSGSAVSLPDGQQDVGDESASILERNHGETSDDVLYFQDVLNDLVFEESRIGIVVRPVPLDLKIGELLRKMPDVERESREQALTFTSFPRDPVLQSSISLVPRRGAPVGTGATGDRIGAARCQAVEQRVTGRADGPAEIGLPWSASTVCARQLPGRCDEIKRSHRSPPGEETIACDSDSTTRISR